MTEPSTEEARLTDAEFDSLWIAGGRVAAEAVKVPVERIIAERVAQAKAEAAEEIAQSIERFAQEVLDAGKRYGWPLTPGNVAKNAGHLEAASEARVFASRIRHAKNEGDKQ